MNHLNTIKLPAVKGKNTIARADEVFSYIDSDFENWGTDKKGEKTEEVELALCELTKDMTFKQIFTKPEEMCLSQAQIIEFCKNHNDKMRQKGYSTLFLFKVDSEFFVAGVGVSADGLRVCVDRFSREFVWFGELRHRIVIPQLTLKHLALDTLSPCPSDPLEILELKLKIGNKEIVFIPKA